MFGTTEKAKIDHFIEVAQHIIKTDPNALTAAQKKSLAVIAEKLKQAPLGSLAELVACLTKKPTPGKTPPKKPAMDKQALDAILAELSRLITDRGAFEARIDALNKKHSAPELVKIAKAFAAGATPKTKGNAVHILKAERNDRERANAKAAEAGSSRPW